MTKFAPLLLLLAAASSAFGANFAFVQAKSQNAAKTLAFATNTTAGDAIVVEMWTFSLSAISDTQGNTFTCGSLNVCTAVNIAGGADTVTVTGSGVGYFASYGMTIAEYSSTAPGYAVTGVYGGSGTAVSGGAFRSATEVMAIMFGFNAYGCPTFALGAGMIHAGGSICITGGEGTMLGDNDVASVPGPYTNTVSNNNEPLYPAVIFMYLTASTPTAFSQLFAITLQ